MATAKYKRGKDGLFQTKVWDGTYVNGKKHRKTLRSEKSSRDLENKVNAFRAEVEARKSVRKSDTTFIDYSRAWFKVYKNSCANNTKAMYNNVIEKHFIALGALRLQDAERIHLQTLLNNANGKNRTQQQIYMTFKQVLNSAVADYLFPANVLEDIFNNVDPVKYDPGEKRPLTDNERTALFKADFGDSDKIFVYILYGCGIRREEAVALTVFDINIKKQELTINKAHEFVKNNPQVKEPKSKNGYRTIPIPDIIFPDVKRYVHSLRAKGRTYLFTMRNGKPITKSSYDKKWARIIRRMQEVAEEPIVKLTAHVFRHNFCTQLCYQIPSVSIKRIAQLIGDTEKMVLEVYNHILTEKENAESAVNNAMNF